MARKAGQGKEEEESRARQQEEKTPVWEEEKTPACDGRGHHVVEQEKLPWPWHLFIAIETITKTTIGTRDWDIAVIGDHVFDWRKMNFGKAVETL
ncbi:hypothetical protein STEG23_005142, partial [Scotinomys teguina]